MGMDMCENGGYHSVCASRSIRPMAELDVPIDDTYQLDLQFSQLIRIKQKKSHSQPL